jgi:hypothetical protein
MAMQRFGIIATIGLGLLLLLACSSTTATKIPPQNTREPASFLLSEPGPYFAGNVEYTLIDDSRNGREIKLLIWYPALKQTDADGQAIVRDAMPDMSNAPYPLILTEGDSGRYLFMSHLATHGFVMIVVKSSPSLEELGGKIVFQIARDFLFSLEQISQNPPDGLKKVMDTDQVGVTGYSYGGDSTLAVSGARVDPEFYLSQCNNISSLVPEAVQWIYEEYCRDARNWDEFVTFMGDEITRSDDGLWQPLTDERIRAVMPMAPTVSWFYGERGLASVDRPTFLIWGTKDENYATEAEYTFEHLIIPDRYLISFIGWDHSLAMSSYPALRIKHFATAFFGYYLQGRKDYTEYLSEEFVSQFDDLAWGAYSDK